MTCKPFNVARTKLCGLLVPNDFVRAFRIPTISNTARHAPPAIIPVPSEAGISNTEAAPKRPSTSCGNVPFNTDTSNNDLRADSPALRMASGTSRAFPRPMPTCPLPSPTTTMMLKLKRRPPLTTFATRLMCTIRSANSRSPGFILCAVIKILVLPLLLHQQYSKPCHDIHSHFDRITPDQFLSPTHAWQ